MRIENAIASEVLERILSSYGFTMQKELGEKLGIAKSNVAGWLQRGQVPGNVIVQCALDTGADVNWLVTGEFDSSHLQINNVSLKGKALYDQILASGGKAVLRRIMDAYGFSTQKELGDLLGISTATISTWVRRNFFPGDVVIACALDTGVSLEWLATGKGKAASSGKGGDLEVNTNRLIPKYRLEAGDMKEAGYWSMDRSLVSNETAQPVYIEGLGCSWGVDTAAKNIGNGRWVVNVDNSYDVFDIVRLPGGRVKLSNNSIDFECGINDILIYGSVIFTLEKNI
ncbi:phage repressor protein CI [Brenneria populi]|uniref:Phage repressor protein CI n=1 Tax=Brenneria populi TaxID=1505588 RepID=A0ABU6JWY7_9GAMM|nr:phage repressor protein CI [Brenneria populi Li et al. 2015]